MRRSRSETAPSPPLKKGQAPAVPHQPGPDCREGSGRTARPRSALPQNGASRPPPQNGASPPHHRRPFSRPFPPAARACAVRGGPAEGAPGWACPPAGARVRTWRFPANRRPRPRRGRGRGEAGLRRAEGAGAKGRGGGRSAGRGRADERTGGGIGQSARRAWRRGRRSGALIGRRGGSAGGRAAWRLLPVGGAAEEKRAAAAAAPGNGEGRGGPGGAGGGPAPGGGLRCGGSGRSRSCKPFRGGAGTWQRPGRASGAPGLVAMGTRRRGEGGS